MFTYISVEELADGVVKNNKDTNRKDLIASLRESLAAKKNGAGCMICGAPIWAAGSGVTGTNTCASPAPPARPTTARITRSNKTKSAGRYAPRFCLMRVFCTKIAFPKYPVPKHIAQDVELC